jgi:CubicO group peptidase (beta-lactamase class C family)
MHLKKIIPIFLIFLIACKEKNTQEKELHALFTTAFKPGEPGGAVLIAKDGKVIYKKGFGLADINSKEAINGATLFNIGSVSKTFVAYGILQLARENKLSLDDAVGKYFPEFKNREIAEKVKIHHLLTHSSGLPDNRKIREDSVFFLTARDDGNWAPVMNNDTLEFEPGEKFNYSNPAFNALALIIEKVSGRKWQEFIREKIMMPAGMKSSTITDGPHPESGVSHGYLFDGKNYFEKDYGEEPTFPASGNGGVWSTVEELWKYEQAIQQNLFLDSGTIHKSRTIFGFPNRKDTVAPFIGLCWFITRFQNHDIIGHTGSQGGFRADYVWVPGEKLFYVILCNTPRELEDIRKEVFDIILKK